MVRLTSPDQLPLKFRGNERIDGTHGTCAFIANDVRIDFCGSQIRMAKQFLHRANIATFAVHLMLHGRPLKYISQLLGYKSTESAVIYTNVLTVDGAHFLEGVDFH